MVPKLELGGTDQLGKEMVIFNQSFVYPILHKTWDLRTPPGLVQCLHFTILPMSFYFSDSAA